ncbi:MAG: PfaD family polyunsaturated fatty acid/polyketide biosynthesis protein [Deltaproteobacteria bacterium]|nr:PfaD family polyunsaturated fatty acid/polyketide biosynthesis protein [Deltaproteobacteria bacterium]
MTQLRCAGFWTPSDTAIATDAASIAAIAQRVREPVHVVQSHDGHVGLATGGQIHAGQIAGSLPLLGTLPPLYPEWLGDRTFNEVHGVRFSYVAGEMANGIATTAMVIAMARAEMLGFFGAAGLSFQRVESAVTECLTALGPKAPWGVNLIHSPNESALEERVARMLVEREVPLVSCSAFMGLTPAVVYASAAGLRVNSQGNIERPRGIFAKISRPEVASRFIAPAPDDMLQALVSRGWLTQEEAQLASRVSVAEDITVESDSGGHTDNRPLNALFPAILSVRDALVAKHGLTRPVRVGAAGGLGTPSAIAAAFSLGAAYVVTGSVNQCAVEAGLSPLAKSLLAKADVADVIMAPAADMFELGVDVQVLRRGTMFGVRAQKLYEIYSTHESMESIAPDVRAKLERDLFRQPLDAVWEETRAFWGRRDQEELNKALREPKHKMALTFRWYLGMASRWAIDGEPSRAADYQVWCGPAMGAFNRWVEGSYLAPQENRTVVQIALNLLEGAAVVTRAQQLRVYGAPVGSEAFGYVPRALD